MLLEGDFQCSLEMGIPHRAKSGSSEVCITLQVPNGEPLVNLHIGNGRVFSGSPGFRGRIVSSSPLKMLNDIQARGELKIIRRGDVFTLLMNDVPFYKGTGDTSPVGNIRIALTGKDSRLELRSIVIRKIK